jgi:plastocyanin
MSNEGVFLKQLGNLVTGSGYIREVPITLDSGASAAALTTNMAYVQFDADDESISIPFQVPLDYDETLDELAVVVTAELITGDNSTNAIAIDLDQVIRARPGAAAVDDMSSSVTSDSQGIAVTVEQYTFDMSSLSLQVGDVLTIEIDAQETGTAVAYVYGVAIRYRSDIVAYNRGDEREVIDTVITND